jgi:hypothetical protein
MLYFAHNYGNPGGFDLALTCLITAWLLLAPAKMKNVEPLPGLSAAA